MSETTAARPHNVAAALSLDLAENEALALLRLLIATPSHSREEHESAVLLEEFFTSHGFVTGRFGNNVWAERAAADPNAPTVMLLSHHDTVRPTESWTLHPYTAIERDGKLHGLGSNDAGAAMCAMAAAFVALKAETLPFRLLCVAAAEEEIAGAGGIVAALPLLGPVDMAIVGEPTGLEAAVAEKGLLVLDCTARGVPGHAARSTGVNAIDIAARDIAWFHSFRVPRESAMLGPVKMTVTQIQSGTQHNVVPDRCDFVVDIRVTDAYTHEEVLDLVRENIASDAQPRSMNLRPSAIAEDHPLLRAASTIGLPLVASPTMSDQARLDMPSIKIGPGRSERSHTADEFVYIDELRQGVRTYCELLHALTKEMQT